MQTIFRLSAWLPLWALHGIGTLLGWLVYGLDGTYRRRLIDHAGQAGIGAADRRSSVSAAGKLVTELPWVWLRPYAQKASRIRWEGAEVLEAALERGKGVILMTPHVGCFEVVPQAFVHRFAPRFGAMTFLYRPSKLHWFGRMQRAAWSGPGMDPVPTTTAGVRLVLKALRQGRVTGLLPDQVPNAGFGVWAPFFGRRAYTMTLAARLAQQTGAELLMAWGDRLPCGRGYVVCIEPLQLPLDRTAEETATALNQAMERLILRRPGMYLWSYARYKQP